MATPNRKTVTGNDLPNRWSVAIAGIVMQIALGAVYAWSVFRIPLSKTSGWTIPQVTFTFSLAIFMLGFAAFGGGLWMRKSGPRAVAMAAGILYGAGVFLASFSGGHLGWHYFSYGVLGGIGLGLGYIVPVATRRIEPRNRGGLGTKAGCEPRNRRTRNQSTGEKAAGTRLTGEVTRQSRATPLLVAREQAHPLT